MPKKYQFLESEHFKKYRDVLRALLDDDTDYTIKQVESIINKFAKKGVK